MTCLLQGMLSVIILLCLWNVKFVATRAHIRNSEFDFGNTNLFCKLCVTCIKRKQNCTWIAKLWRTFGMCLGYKFEFRIFLRGLLLSLFRLICWGIGGPPPHFIKNSIQIKILCNSSIRKSSISNIVIIIFHNRGVFLGVDTRISKTAF